MSIRVVIQEFPDNVHSRYHVALDFDVPETWTKQGTGKMRPTPLASQGFIGAHDDLSVALAAARQVIGQGIQTTVALPGRPVISEYNAVHLISPGKILTALCGATSRPSDMTEHRENSTCPACLIVRQA